MQIENSCSLLKVYTTSLLNVCTRGKKLGIQRTALAQNRDGRKERKGREERRYLVCFEDVVDAAIYTANGTAAGEKKKELVWCRVFA